jgi:MarR family transcriptional regulator, 2-MHQ and catechol-resistance regulon repressor
MAADSVNSSYETAVEGYKLFFNLRLTSDAIHKYRETELNRYRISPEQALALICIYSLDKKATPAELSRWLHREPNSITILLNRMEKLDLIKKKADLKRKNVIRLSLTPKGVQAYRHAVEFRMFSVLMDVLSERKRKQLLSILQVIRKEVYRRLDMNINAFTNTMDKAVFEPGGPKAKVTDTES